MKADGADRGAGKRVIGPYVRHMRPLAFPVVSFHLAVGFLVAHPGEIQKLQMLDWCGLFAAMGIWGVLLNGGTLAINTAFDKDEGDIGYLFNPPPIPPHLVRFSLALMIAGLVLSPLLGWRFVAAYAVCFVMSLLYSAPPVRLKARAGWDLLINCLGYGMLTFYAGWAATRRAADWRCVFVCAGYAALYVALYPLTQIYQVDEDARHGDRTLAVMLGKRRAVNLSLAGMGAAFVLFALHVNVLGFRWPVLGLGLALAAWCAVLVPWLVKRERYNEKRGMYRALWAWALTDIALAVNAIMA